MDFLTNLLTGGASGLLGGITGLFGGAITAFTNFKMQKLKNAHDLVMLEAETNAMIAESNAATEREKARVEGEIEVAEVTALTASYKEAAKPSFDSSYMKMLMEDGRWFYPRVIMGTLIAFLLGVVDFIKALCRPFLTFYLMGASTWVTLLAYKILLDSLGEGNVITPEQAFELFNIAINTVMYLTVTCVSWWFADRRTAKFLNRLNDGNLK